LFNAVEERFKKDARNLSGAVAWDCQPALKELKIQFRAQHQRRDGSRPREVGCRAGDRQRYGRQARRPIELAPVLTGKNSTLAVSLDGC
jgi:hypothetical protein